jgi:peptide deformylase
MFARVRRAVLRSFATSASHTPSVDVVKLLGHPVLRQKCLPVPAQHITAESNQAIYNRLTACLRANEGLGLAAPQIGESLRVFAFQKFAGEPYASAAPTIVINPVIVSRSAELEPDLEVCLSVPEYGGIVQRASTIKVQYHTRTGTEVSETLSGLSARIFQHEFDHLDGVLYVDRLQNITQDLKHIDEWQRSMNQL